MIEETNLSLDDIIQDRIDKIENFVKVESGGDLGLHSSFFDELLFNSIDSINWQSFKVADLKIHLRVAKGANKIKK